MDRKLLTMITDSEVDQFSELLAYVRVDKIDWSDFKVLGWYLYDFITELIIVSL